MSVRKKYRKLTASEISRLGLRDSNGPLLDFVRDNFPKTAAKATLTFRYDYNNGNIEPCHLIVIDVNGKELPINDIAKRESVRYIDIKPEEYEEDYPEGSDSATIIADVKEIPDLYVLE